VTVFLPSDRSLQQGRIVEVQAPIILREQVTAHTTACRLLGGRRWLRWHGWTIVTLLGSDCHSAQH